MSEDSTDRYADLAERMRRQNKTRVQLRLVVAGVVVAGLGILVPVRVADAVGL